MPCKYGCNKCDDCKKKAGYKDMFSSPVRYGSKLGKYKPVFTKDQVLRKLAFNPNNDKYGTMVSDKKAYIFMLDKRLGLMSLSDPRYAILTQQRDALQQQLDNLTIQRNDEIKKRNDVLEYVQSNSGNIVPADEIYRLFSGSADTLRRGDFTQHVNDLTRGRGSAEDDIEGEEFADEPSSDLPPDSTLTEDSDLPPVHPLSSLLPNPPPPGTHVGVDTRPNSIEQTMREIQGQPEPSIQFAPQGVGSQTDYKYMIKTPGGITWQEFEDLTNKPDTKTTSTQAAIEPNATEMKPIRKDSGSQYSLPQRQRFSSVELPTIDVPRTRPQLSSSDSIELFDHPPTPLTDMTREEMVTVLSYKGIRGTKNLPRESLMMILLAKPNHMQDVAKMVKRGVSQDEIPADYLLDITSPPSTAPASAASSSGSSSRGESLQRIARS